MLVNYVCLLLKYRHLFAHNFENKDKGRVSQQVHEKITLVSQWVLIVNYYL